MYHKINSSLSKAFDKIKVLPLINIFMYSETHMINVTKQKTNNYYSYFQAIVLSFFSPAVYRDAAKRWSGVGAFYLLLLSFILTVPMAYQFIQKTRHYFAEWIEPSVAAMPTLMMGSNGAMFIKPHTGKGEVKNQMVWVWPPKQKTTKMHPAMLINLPRNVDSFKSVYIPILITQNVVRIQTMSPLSEAVITDVVKITKSPNFVLGSKELGQMAKQVKMSLLVTIYPYLAWGLWVIVFISLIFFSFVLNLMSYAFLLIKLPWKQASRILCLAITPSLIFLEFLYLTHLLTQYRLFFLIGLTLVYYLFGVRASQEVEQESLSK